MPIEKLIKIYFVFAMVMVSMAGLTYNDRVHNYMTSVLLIDSESNVPVSVPREHNIDVMDSGTTGNVFSTENLNSASVNFTMLNDRNKAHASPGEKDVEVMKFKIKTSDKDTYLKSIKLKISGTDPQNIKNLRISDGNEFIEEGLKGSNYFTFDTLNYRVEKGDFSTLLLMADLGEELKSGQRLRFDIESPNDLVFMVGGKPYSVNGYYPLKGRALSIILKRAWSKSSSVVEISEVEAEEIQD